MNNKVPNEPLSFNDIQAPVQFLALIQTGELRQLISALFIGLKVIPPDERPEWAIRAGCEFWNCVLRFPKSKEAKSPKYRLVIWYPI